MRFTRVGMGLLAAFAMTAGLAVADDLPIGGMTAQEVANWMRGRGYSARVVRKSGDKYQVKSSAHGVNFHIDFYSCSRNNRCGSMQFVAGFHKRGGMTQGAANAWNRVSRWTTLSLDSDRDPWLARDVLLSPGGTYAMLGKELSLWDTALTLFVKVARRVD